MGDVVGRLFREFAITLAVSILISAVVSLTLTPMMCAKLLRHTPPEQQGRFYRWSGSVLRPHRSHRYGRMLNWVLDRQGATLVVALADAGADRAALRRRSPRASFPVQDTGRDPGHLGSAADDLLRRDGASASRRSPKVVLAGPRGREPVVVHRRRRHQRDAQQRPHADQPQAARAARRMRHRRDPAPAAASSPHVDGHLAVHAAGAGPDDRGPRQPHAIPVHRRGRRRDGARRRGCRGWSNA